MNTLTLFETHTWSSEMGDYIGMESCVDLKPNEDVAIYGGCTEKEYGKRDRRWKTRREKKEYPPPIPSLARSENLPTSDFPWEFNRYYTSDGRLIIREEKVRHHEYFRAHRSDGRLTLQLIPDDGDDDDEERGDNNVESKQDQEDGDPGDNVISDGGEDRTKDRSVEEQLTVKLPQESGTVVGGGGGSKCYNYTTVRSNPCMFGLPVPAIWPVHI